MKQFIDIHCHLFDRKILTVRIIAELVEAILGITDKNENIKEYNSPVELHKSLKKTKKEIEHIIDFFKIVLKKNSTEVFEVLEENYDFKYLVVPLTMDLEYCFEDDYDNFSQFELEKILHEPIKKFDNYITSYTNNAIKAHSLFKKDNKTYSNINKIDFLFDKFFLAYKKFKKHISFFKENSTELENLIFRKNYLSSFDKQIKDIKELKENPKYRNKVFPFYAVDPRRKDIRKLLEENIYPQGDFYGVKLYAPNGYSPLDNELIKEDGIYDFCIKNKIPITAHCSHMGFATFMNEITVNGEVYDKKNKRIYMPEDNKVTFKTELFEKGWIQERAETLNHPKLWEKVLEKYTDLKLNLAHFGNSEIKPINGSEYDFEWTEIIKELMNKYDNLYTDLSCYTDYEKLKTIKTEYFCKASNEIKKRFLYGSDFSLNITKISMKNYLRNFHNVFNDEEFELLASTNNTEFLGLNKNPNILT